MPNFFIVNLFFKLLVSITLGSTEPPVEILIPAYNSEEKLKAYLFKPKGDGPFPAIVLLNGRSGLYSSLKKNEPVVSSFSKRHSMWAKFWSESGYVALFVDSFSTRGYPNGFPKHSYKDRPASVSEESVRPLDAYAGLKYLQQQPYVKTGKIGVQGWSNGGMTILNLIKSKPSELPSFSAAVAFYPSCRQHLKHSYNYSTPLLILSASEDDEVSAEVCRSFYSKNQSTGAKIEFVLFEGAQHSFDDPSKKKQSHKPNRDALEKSKKIVREFFQRHLEN